MKKAARWPYLGLTLIPLPPDEHTANLCSFCKYASWEGSCDDREAICQHPLWFKILWRYTHFVGEGFGQDCWGFRPKVDIPTADGMVVNWLTGKDAILEVLR